MANFTADTLLQAASTLKTRYIPAEELGLEAGLWVRELTAWEREEILKSGGGQMKIQKDGSQVIDMASLPAGVAVKLVLTAVVTDETGTEQMFDRRKHERDIKRMSGRVIDTIARYVRQLSGMGDDEEAEEKKVSTPLSDAGTN